MSDIFSDCVWITWITAIKDIMIIEHGIGKAIIISGYARLFNEIIVDPANAPFTTIVDQMKKRIPPTYQPMTV